MKLHPKHILIVIFTLSGFALQAQRPTEQLTGLSQRPQVKESAVKSSAQHKQAVVNLPFIDDFSYEGPWPNSQLWEDRYVFVNQTLPASPITLGAATFDGLNEAGYAYDLNRNNTLATDTLSSRVIDLANPVDSVYLSFFYQAGGNGEIPVSQDSFNLQFWNGRDTSWNHIWGVQGGQATAFQQVMLYVDTSYHRSDFRFRFISYGNPSGAFDHWHLDYVRLDDQRSFNDLTVRDIAFTRPHPSLLNNFESIPWFHIADVINLNALGKNDLRLFYRRNVDTNQSRPSMFLGEFTIEFNGNIVDQNGQPDADLDNLHDPLVETRFPVPDTADAGRPRLSFFDSDPANTYLDEFEFISTQYYSGSSQNYSANDTLRKVQSFKNYYAYDDGSAERGYEILNNSGGYIVQKYDLFAPDTLIGIHLYFQPAFYDVEDNQFSIIVLENDNGLPGEILFESDSIYDPQYTDHNFYLPYLLDTAERTLAPGSTVFIGIRQQNANPLTLGFDKNRVGTTTAFYGKVNDFYQSFLEGTIMMRPFFRYVPRDISLPEVKHKTLDFALYPNPAQHLLNIAVRQPGFKWEKWQYQLISITGQTVLSGLAEATIHLPDLPQGVYVFEMKNSQSGQSSQQKLMIR